MPKTLIQLIEKILTYGRNNTNFTWPEGKPHLTPIHGLASDILVDVIHDISEMDDTILQPSPDAVAAMIADESEDQS